MPITDAEHINVVCYVFFVCMALWFCYNGYRLWLYLQLRGAVATRRYYMYTADELRRTSLKKKVFDDIRMGAGQNIQIVPIVPLRFYLRQSEISLKILPGGETVIIPSSSPGSVAVSPTLEGKAAGSFLSRTPTTVEYSSFVAPPEALRKGGSRAYVFEGTSVAPLTNSASSSSGGGGFESRPLWMGFDVIVHKATHTMSVAASALFTVSSLDLLKELWDSLGVPSSPQMGSGGASAGAPSSPTRLGGGIVKYMARIKSGGKRQQSGNNNNTNSKTVTMSGSGSTLTGGKQQSRGLRGTSSGLLSRAQGNSTNKRAAGDFGIHPRVLSEELPSASSGTATPTTRDRHSPSFATANSNSIRHHRTISATLAPLTPAGHTSMVRTDRGEYRAPQQQPQYSTLHQGMQPLSLDSGSTGAASSRLIMDSRSGDFASIDSRHQALANNATPSTAVIRPVVGPGSNNNSTTINVHNAGGEEGGMDSSEDLSPLQFRRRQRAAGTVAPLMISVPKGSAGMSVPTTPTVLAGPPPREPMTPMSPQVSRYDFQTPISSPAANALSPATTTILRENSAMYRSFATSRSPMTATLGAAGTPAARAGKLAPPPHYRSIEFANPVFEEQLMQLEFLVEEGEGKVGFDMEPSMPRERGRAGQGQLPTTTGEDGELGGGDSGDNNSFIRQSVGIADTTVPIVVVVEELPPVIPSKRMGLIYTSSIAPETLRQMNSASGGEEPEIVFDLQLTFLRNGTDLFRLYPIYNASGDEEPTSSFSTPNYRFGGVEGIPIRCGGGPNFNFKGNYAPKPSQSAITTPQTEALGALLSGTVVHSRTFSATSTSSFTTDGGAGSVFTAIGDQLRVGGGEDHHDERDDDDELDESDLCIICFTEQKAVITMPCAHYAVCMNCVKRLKECPLCRKPICETVFLLRPVGDFANRNILGRDQTPSALGTTQTATTAAPTSDVRSPPMSIAVASALKESSSRWNGATPLSNDKGSEGGHLQLRRRVEFDVLGAEGGAQGSSAAVAGPARTRSAAPPSDTATLQTFVPIGHQRGVSPSSPHMLEASQNTCAPSPRSQTDNLTLSITQRPGDLPTTAAAVSPDRKAQGHCRKRGGALGASSTSDVANDSIPQLPVARQSMTEQEYVESLLNHLQGRGGDAAAAAGGLSSGGGVGDEIPEFNLDDTVRLLVGALKLRLKRAGSFRRDGSGGGPYASPASPHDVSVEGDVASRYTSSEPTPRTSAVKRRSGVGGAEGTPTTSPPHTAFGTTPPPRDPETGMGDFDIEYEFPSGGAGEDDDGLPSPTAAAAAAVPPAKHKKLSLKDKFAKRCGKSIPSPSNGLAGDDVELTLMSMRGASVTGQEEGGDDSREGSGSPPRGRHGGRHDPDRATAAPSPFAATIAMRRASMSAPILPFVGRSPDRDTNNGGALLMTSSEGTVIDKGACDSVGGGDGEGEGEELRSFGVDGDGSSATRRPLGGGIGALNGAVTLAEVSGMDQARRGGVSRKKVGSAAPQASQRGGTSPTYPLQGQPSFALSEIDENDLDAFGKHAVSDDGDGSDDDDNDDPAGRTEAVNGRARHDASYASALSSEEEGDGDAGGNRKAPAAPLALDFALRSLSTTGRGPSPRSVTEMGGGGNVVSNNTHSDADGDDDADGGAPQANQEGGAHHDQPSRYRTAADVYGGTTSAASAGDYGGRDVAQFRSDAEGGEGWFKIPLPEASPNSNGRRQRKKGPNKQHNPYWDSTNDDDADSGGFRDVYSTSGSDREEEAEPAAPSHPPPLSTVQASPTRHLDPQATAAGAANEGGDASGGGLFAMAARMMWGRGGGHQEHQSTSVDSPSRHIDPTR